VGALVSDIADLKREAVRKLPLDGQVVGVERGQRLFVGQSRGDDLVRQRESAVAGTSGSGRQPCEVEALSKKAGFEGLDGQDRRVLGDGVPKVGKTPMS
jgi:hypothetical protein